MRFDLLVRANRVNEQINIFLENKKNFPVVSPANTVCEELNYKVGVYGHLAGKASSEIFLQDLFCFLNEKRKYPLDLESFWAVFYDTKDLSEQQFQEKLWKELFYIAKMAKEKKNWSLDFKVNSSKNTVSFNLYGEEFYILGLHSIYWDCTAIQILLKNAFVMRR